MSPLKTRIGSYIAKIMILDGWELFSRFLVSRYRTALRIADVKHVKQKLFAPTGRYDQVQSLCHWISCFTCFPFMVCKLPRVEQVAKCSFLGAGFWTESDRCEFLSISRKRDGTSELHWIWTLFHDDRTDPESQRQNLSIHFENTRVEIIKIWLNIVFSSKSQKSLIQVWFFSLDFDNSVKDSRPIRRSIYQVLALIGSSWNFGQNLFLRFRKKRSRFFWNLDNDSARLFKRKNHHLCCCASFRRSRKLSNDTSASVWWLYDA